MPHPALLMPRPRVLRPAGFTLVELLVVIGIIALLISILLPSLNKARKQADLVKCASNLRQIGIASNAYAADNRGFLPTRYRGNVAGTTWAGQELTNTVWEVFADPNKPNVPYGLGLLFTGRYVGDGKVFYCPTQRDNGFNVEAIPFPFMSVKSESYYTTYMYQPLHTDLSPTPAPPVEVRYRKLSQVRGSIPPNAVPGASGVTDFGGLEPVLAVEMIRNFRWSSHANPQEKGTPQFNLLFGDGSVRTVSSKSARDTLAGFFANNQGGVSNGWTRFDRVLKALLADARAS